MRFSPIKLLHGLLYAVPVLLLTLVACGGGSSTPSAPPAAAYTVGGGISGLTSNGLVLRNNGGDDLTAASGVASYTFATPVANGGSYDVSVLTQPGVGTTSPQLCTVANASGSIAGANVTNANVSCVNAYTISGTISGDSTIAVSGIGPILQNNGGDDLFIPVLPASGVAATFTFSTPVASGAHYAVTQLSQAKSPGQNCNAITGGDTSNNGTGTAIANVTSITITCVSNPIVPKYAYVTNSTANTVSAYTINAASGVLAASTTPTTAAGNGPYSVSVDPTGRFAYVANQSSNNISAYSISTGSTGTGALTPIDANGAVAGTQATIAAGTYPLSVTIHPSGKFAYVANQTTADVSVYSINTTTGALSAIDANGAVAGIQATIAAGTLPYAVTIDPLGRFAYVANYDSNNVSAYTINQTSGALTFVANYTAGTGPSSVAIDPHGKFVLVTNNISNDVSAYAINQISGVLTSVGAAVPAGVAPRSVAIDPNTGVYAYVANAGDGTVSAYTIGASGALTHVADYSAGTTPISVNVDPSGQFVYVANFGSNNVSTYTIGSGGTLTPGTTTPTGASPTSVTTTQ